MDNKTQRKQAEKALSNETAELFLTAAKNGTLTYRVGRILKVPKMRGQSVLLLDYDSGADGRRLPRPRLRVIRERLSLAGVRLVQAEFHRSPSGLGWHGVLYIRGKFNRYQRLALAAILESDPDHIAIAFKRAQILDEKEFDSQGWLLFKKPE
jgi:hypothetical protein